MGIGSAVKLTAGDSTISASEFNRHVDAANIVLGQQQLGTPATPLRLEYDTNRITVKNDSGADRRRGEILEFTGSPLTAAGTNIAVSAAKIMSHIIASSQPPPSA